MRRVTWIGGPYDGASVPAPDDVEAISVEDVDGIHWCPVVSGAGRPPDRFVLWQEATA